MHASIALFLLSGCLVNEAKYLERRADLTDADGDGFARADDCDDADATVFPDAAETCDGRDQDCDGAIDEDAADAPTWHADRDGDGFGAHGDLTTACDAPTGYTDDATDCDDADDATHPGAADTPYDGVDQDCAWGDPDDLDGDGFAAEAADGDDCDDTDATVHPGAVEGWGDGFTDNDCDGEVEAVEREFGSTAWLGPHAGAHAGRRVARLGDTDGDGCDTLLIGSLFDAGVHPNGGAVYLVTGTPGGSVTDFPSLVADASDLYLGAAMDGGEDIDGDGIDDMVVTGTGFHEGTGAAWLVSGAAVAGGAHSVARTSFVQFEGDAPGGYFGSSAAFLGDVTGDGVTDIAVGAPYASAGGITDAGRVGIWSADALSSGTIDDAAHLVEGSFEGASIGNHVGEAGDIDGDGYDDFVVSGNGDVLAFVLPGGVSEWDVDDALFRLTGAGVVTGGGVQMVGDLNADGAWDLAYSTEEDVRIYTSLAGTPTRSIYEQSGIVRLGDGSYVFDLLGLPDADGDGHDELLVPVQWYESENTSVITIFPGAMLGFGADLTGVEAPLLARSVRPTSRFAYRVTIAGDLDGDGHGDLAIGGFMDDQAAEDAGAVTSLPIPE